MASRALWLAVSLAVFAAASCLVPNGYGNAFVGRVPSPPPASTVPACSRKEALARLEENRAARASVSEQMMDVIERQKAVRSSGDLEEWDRLELAFNELIQREDELRAQMTQLVKVVTKWPVRRTGTAFRKLLRDL